MRFDYILFDLDNCLLNIPNPNEYFDNVLVKTLDKIKAKITPERTLRDQFWFSGEYYLQMLKDWGVNDPVEFWRNFDEIDYNIRKNLIENQEIGLYNDVYPVLEKLYIENKKLAIITNTADYIVDFILEKFKIESFFHEVFGLSYAKDQSIAKPSPKGILSVLKKLNFKKSKNSSALMVGDSKADIFAAKRAHINACLIKRDQTKYKNGFSDWEHKPDYLINKLDDLFKI